MECQQTSVKIQKNKKKILFVVFHVLTIELKNRIEVDGILDLIRGYRCIYKGDT